ncbi:kinase-like domain-containing protein [Rhizophagus irregularis DAOM 181602=DAOM 197198]|nr:kinase-like domain-containing protein [Rhizophagus irregularis DAOM 181602=DAOM 197198]
MFFQDDEKCEKCDEKYTSEYNAKYKWCKLCHINNLKNNFFTNCTSDDDTINTLIQGIQLEIDEPDDMIFEWIPYNQFNDIKEIGEEGFDKVKSDFQAFGEVGEYNNLLIYGISQNPDTQDYIMIFPNESCKRCGERFIDKNYANEVKAELNKYHWNFSKLDTKDFILVLQEGYDDKCEKCIHV